MRNPTLFDMGFDMSNEILSFNPFATGEHYRCSPQRILNSTHPYPDSAGWCADLLQYYSHKKTKYNPGHYKYIVVPRAEVSTSGRLAHLLAHSGAVILLANSPYYYHFSARLRPWVHYVPVSNNLADLADRVRWLQAHDDLARRIASNGQAFADSYLRKEDYLCYAAAALRAAADVFKGTTALKPFNPKPVCESMDCKHLLEFG